MKSFFKLWNSKALADINRVINLTPKYFLEEVNKIEDQEVLKNLMLGLHREKNQLQQEHLKPTANPARLKMMFDDLSQMLQIIGDRMTQIAPPVSDNHGFVEGQDFFKIYAQQQGLSLFESEKIVLKGIQINTVYPLKNLEIDDHWVFKKTRIECKEKIDLIVGFLKKLDLELFVDREYFKNPADILVAAKQVCIFSDYFKTHYSIKDRNPAELEPLLNDPELIFWMDQKNIHLNENLPDGFSNDFLAHAVLSAFGAFKHFGVQHPLILRAIVYHQENRLVPEIENLSLFELLMYVAAHLKTLSNPWILEVAINDLRSNPADARFYLERLLFAALTDLIDKELAGTAKIKFNQKLPVFSEIHPKTLAKIFKKQKGYYRFVDFILDEKALRENVFLESDYQILLPLYEEMHATRKLHVNKVKQWLLLRERLRGQWDMTKETEATLVTATEYLKAHLNNPSI